MEWRGVALHEDPQVSLHSKHLSLLVAFGVKQAALGGAVGSFLSVITLTFAGQPVYPR